MRGLPQKFRKVEPQMWGLQPMTELFLLDMRYYATLLQPGKKEKKTSLCYDFAPTVRSFHKVNFTYWNMVNREHHTHKSNKNVLMWFQLLDCALFFIYFVSFSFIWIIYIFSFGRWIVTFPEHSQISQWFVVDHFINVKKN